MGTNDKKKRREARRVQTNPDAKIQEGSNPVDSAITGLSGVDEMSEIVLDFAESLRELVDDEDTILTLAMGAWNIAIFPKRVHSEKIDELVVYCLPHSGPQATVKIRDVVNTLVSRKLDLYRDNKIVLRGYERIDLGDKMALNIISSVGRSM